jgi:hypothetical protein
MRRGKEFRLRQRGCRVPNVTHGGRTSARRKFSPEELAALGEGDAELIEMDLRTMRDLLGKTQVEVPRPSR